MIGVKETSAGGSPVAVEVGFALPKPSASVDAVDIASSLAIKLFVSDENWSKEVTKSS